LTEGQTAVLGRAAAALRSEREQAGRLNALVAVGKEARVGLAEDELLRQAVRRAGEGFERDGIRVGLLTEGRLVFPAELSTEGSEQVEPGMAETAQEAIRDLEPISADGDLLALPLTVKDRPAGVLLARRGGLGGDGARTTGYGERDRALLASLASQLSIGLENARLYHQLDGLFRQYMSPDVVTTLLADPAQAALGGAVVEVTVVFADLRGFTGFSERSSPEEIVTVLNRYFEIATAAVVAEGGTVVQFMGDALMVLFNAPTRQPDHAVRAARSGLELQARVEEVAAANEGWPRFRVGVNTGEALVGNIGSTDLRSFSAIGDAVNVAARLESVAVPGQVVIGDTTRRLLGDAADVEPLGELTVKGRQAPVAGYLLRKVHES
jgi:class 3 adenylate cyclase